MTQDWPYGLEDDIELADRLEVVLEHLQNGIAAAARLKDWTPFTPLPDAEEGRPSH